MSIARQTPQTLKQLANITLGEPNDRFAPTVKKQTEDDDSGKEDYEYTYKRNSNTDHALLDSNKSGQNPLKLLKKLQQKRQEAELWKQKYESQINQMVQIKQNYEKEIKQFQREVKSLLDRIDEMQVQKKPFDSNESNLRKMREMIEAKNDEIVRYQQQAQDDDQEIKRLLDDNHSLRQTIQNMEVEKQKQRTINIVREINDLLELKTRENHQAHTIDQQFNEMDHLEREIEQLHKLLEVKNDEIESLLNENLAQKELFQQEFEKIQNHHERVLCDIKFHHRDELSSFEHQITEIHRKELTRMNQKQEGRIQELVNENQKLRDQINQLPHLQSQLDQQKRELDSKQKRLIDLESLRNRGQLEFEDKMRKLQSQLGEDLRHQINVCQEKDSLINQLQSDIIDLSQAVSYLEEDRQSQEELINRQKIEVEQLRLKIYEIELDKDKELDSVQKQFDANEQHNRERIRMLTIQIESYDLEIKRSKEILDAKSNEIDNLLIGINLLERDNRRCRDEIDDLRASLLKEEKLKIQSLEQQAIDLDSKAQIEHMKSILNFQMTNLQSENRELKVQLEKKTSELYETNNRITEVLRKRN